MADTRISIARTATIVVAVLAVGWLAAVLGCSPAAPPEPEAEVADAPDAAPQPEVPKPLWQQHVDELQPEVESWARAWSNQDVEAYLAHYSPDFKVPGGMSREGWEAQRRDRLTRPSSITVELTGFQNVGFNKGFMGGRERQLVRVQFRQKYSSDTFSDEVDKELQLELVDLTWKIITETSL